MELDDEIVYTKIKNGRLGLKEFENYINKKYIKKEKRFSQLRLYLQNMLSVYNENSVTLGAKIRNTIYKEILNIINNIESEDMFNETI